MCPSIDLKTPTAVSFGLLVYRGFLNLLRRRVALKCAAVVAILICHNWQMWRDTTYKTKALRRSCAVHLIFKFYQIYLTGVFLECWDGTFSDDSFVERWTSGGAMEVSSLLSPPHFIRKFHTRLPSFQLIFALRQDPRNVITTPESIMTHRFAPSRFPNCCCFISGYFHQFLSVRQQAICNRR